MKKFLFTLLALVAFSAYADDWKITDNKYEITVDEITCTITETPEGVSLSLTPVKAKTMDLKSVGDDTFKMDDIEMKVKGSASVNNNGWADFILSQLKDGNTVYISTKDINVKLPPITKE